MAEAPGRRRSPIRTVIETMRDRWRGLQVLAAATGTDLLELLDVVEPDVIIGNEGLPDLAIEDLVARIRQRQRCRTVPVLVVGPARRHLEAKLIAAGADEYLRRPVDPGLLVARAGSYLPRPGRSQAREDVEPILFTLAQTVEHRDAYTAGHCQRLADLAVRLGRRLGLAADETEALHRGGYLHDIGKIAVPDAILFKAGPLNHDEWAIMRSHTWKGVEICRPLAALTRVLPIIRHHHERWDGSGYPDQLRGEEIPLLARILQVVDIYDALTTDRPYKPALSPSIALDTLRHEARLGWRDPDLVRLFCELMPGAPAEPLRASA